MSTGHPHQCHILYMWRIRRYRIRRRKNLHKGRPVDGSDAEVSGQNALVLVTITTWHRLHLTPNTGTNTYQPKRLLLLRRTAHRQLGISQIKAPRKRRHAKDRIVRGRITRGYLRLIHDLNPVGLGSVSGRPETEGRYTNTPTPLLQPHLRQDLLIS